LNGIFSLILNTTDPQSAYPEEEQRAVSYFHRSRAVELLALLDKNFPDAESRPELHAKVIEFYSNNGQSEAVLSAGKEFLASFPKTEERTRVALLMADADARLQKPEDEFAIYDTVLQELAAKADNVPLGDRVSGADNFGASRFDNARGGESDEKPESADASSQPPNAAFQVQRDTSAPENGPRSPDYSRVLERYLARLVELKEVPRALGVLRREIDRNPDDPGLYEHLAMFLQQNDLSAEQEEVYRRAFARFSDPSWYSKLARLYLRYRKYSELEQLTQDAVKQFDGNVLQSYFASVRGGTPAMYVRLNQYANQKFPHNLYFVHNLLGAYHSPPTYDQAAWLALIREHWFEDAGLRDEYFEYLSSTNQLEGELSVLRQSAPGGNGGDWTQFVKNDPAAAEELADAEIWRSHFEESAPVLKVLAEAYPADNELDRNASSVFRSLAYFDASETEVAAKIDENLLAANPGDTEILARIGDIYSDRERFQRAAPYWERIPKVTPGDSNGYLEAATIYWDYFDFGNALRLMDEGRAKLANPTLYGYEEGAIYESRAIIPEPFASMRARLWRTANNHPRWRASWNWRAGRSSATWSTTRPKSWRPNRTIHCPPSGCACACSKRRTGGRIWPRSSMRRLIAPIPSSRPRRSRRSPASTRSKPFARRRLRSRRLSRGIQSRGCNCGMPWSNFTRARKIFRRRGAISRSCTRPIRKSSEWSDRQSTSTGE